MIHSIIRKKNDSFFLIQQWKWEEIFFSIKASETFSLKLEQENIFHQKIDLSKYFFLLNETILKDGKIVFVFQKIVHRPIAQNPNLATLGGMGEEQRVEGGCMLIFRIGS